MMNHNPPKLTYLAHYRSHIELPQMRFFKKIENIQILWRRMAALLIDLASIAILASQFKQSFISFVNLEVLFIQENLRNKMISDVEGHSLFIPIVLMSFIYYFFCNYFYHGITFGKKWMKLVVVPINFNPLRLGHDQDMTFKQALVRTIGMVFAIASRGLLFILTLFSDEKLSIHDYISQTKTIPLEYYEFHQQEKIFHEEHIFIDLNLLHQQKDLLNPCPLKVA